MINYNENLKQTRQLKSIVTQERAVINDFQIMQSNLKLCIDLYSEEISILFKNNAVFKNMLLTSLDTALLQIEMNSEDLNNLSNILDVILTDKEQIEQNIEQYNILFSKAKKNINIVKKIIQKAITSFEELSSVYSTSSNSFKSNNEKLAKAKKTIMDSEEKEQEKTQARIHTHTTRKVKEITDKASSDLLCFFPKTDNDILAMSTVQDTYKITFDEKVATICIQEEDFNFTLKTVGVQISNSENILLVSRENTGYSIITNMPVEVPNYINISRINRNKSFMEFSVTNKELSISIEKNSMYFLDEFHNEKNEKNTELKCEKTNNDNLIDNISNPTLINKVFGEPTLNNQVADLLTPPILSSQITPPTFQSSTSPVENQNDINLMKDNDTLIISEKDNQVILPYKLSEVEKQFKKSKKKYSSIEDLIQNEYIVPTANFKNPIKSRFREAYQLIKKKEHGHLKEALELGFELMFQSNLNPAIIAACKNLKELDIYLDCLDDDELDKFSCFNIVYNVPPAKHKK